MPKKLEKDNNSGVTINTVQNIIDYMEENLYEELTPNRIAAQFFLSISAMNSMFKIVCNMTIMEYVRNRRLSLAGQELIRSNVRVIDVAFKYGYETPEAFAKAFTRFHGYPPSFIRRIYPKIKMFNPVQIKMEISGGWEENILSDKQLSFPTKPSYPEQDKSLFYCYDDTTKYKGGVPMDKERYEHRISVNGMKQKENWRILLLLARKLDENGIKFKVDGKTMIFAHGLEFKLEKICLTFKWKEEQRILDFFGYDGKAKSSFESFKYFDTMFEGMKIRCMFYRDCQDDDSDDFLFRNAEPVMVDGQIIYVQTLEFYIENSEPDNKYYKMVNDWLKLRG
ncbi:MAG: helix-turn-helix transcriptional regulator [Lachnospiraceae bacterium]|jgi:AraC-like DNA-binding protein|nr:helix-turn-helix transcriptional regulator [Lachnospiraceae bacterium]